MNHIEWIHIMDRQPENKREIIHIDPPYEGHYNMGMRTWELPISWEEYLAYCKKHHIENDFHWVYAEDFPFPKSPN